MNDFDLESKLKSVPLPERSEEYWNDFPSQIRVQLRGERREFTPRNVWRPRLAWAGGCALAIALICICIQCQTLQSASAALDRHERHFRAQLAQLDASLHVLMFNPHGMGYLLAEAN